MSVEAYRTADEVLLPERESSQRLDTSGLTGPEIRDPIPVGVLGWSKPHGRTTSHL
jgi:hypothetical protein